LIIWINGAFGSGKTTAAYELRRRLPNSFLYDPEQIGYFLRKHTPPQMQKDDFQHYELWRKFNVDMLTQFSKHYSGVIIVPMTIVDEQYFNEIITALKINGINLYHFSLLASRETLLKRLRHRGHSKHSWPAKQIDRCITSLSKDSFGQHIDTEHLRPEEVIEHIALTCKLSLLKDDRGLIKKRFDRLLLRYK